MNMMYLDVSDPRPVRKLGSDCFKNQFRFLCMHLLRLRSLSLRSNQQSYYGWQHREFIAALSYAYFTFPKRR